MNYIYPPKKKLEFDAELEQAIQKEREDCHSKQTSFIAFNSPSKPDKKTCTIIGVCVGFLFMIWGAILGYFIADTIYGYLLNKYKKRCSELEQEAKEKFEPECEQNIEKLKKEYENKYSDYVKSFELHIQDESVKLADSNLTIEVIDWITDGFSKTIDAADRSPHIKQIDVPFIFNIYKNKITCNLGTYDFEIKRCNELKDDAQKIALSRAIASAIQFNITMKYPKDVSGTDITVKTAYKYNYTSSHYEDYATAEISYTAVNGEYQIAKEW